MTDYSDPPGRIGRTSRLDNEVERLRRSPRAAGEPAAGVALFVVGGVRRRLAALGRPRLDSERGRHRGSPGQRG